MNEKKIAPRINRDDLFDWLPVVIFCITAGNVTSVAC